MNASRVTGAGLGVDLDEASGLPCGISCGGEPSAVPLELAVELETGGREVAGTMGGLAYQGTIRLAADRLVPGSLEHTTAGPREFYAIEAEAGDWRVRLRIGFSVEHPGIELHVAATPTEGAEHRILRDLHLRADLTAADLSQWKLEAPGNAIRAGVGATDLREPVTIKTAGDQLGSPGFVALHREERPLTLFLWPLSRSESGDLQIEPQDDGLRWHLSTQLGGALEPGEWLEHGPIHLDLIERSWDELRGEIKRWYENVGVATPPDQPAWSATTNIFEVMIGSAPFRGGVDYAPYPELLDLQRDLDRIAELGFDCIQLMPRHPYPSYNIHEPGDVATTYGDPDELRALIKACHERGLRLILDILLHGVIDHESMQRAIDAVENGPHADNLDDPCTDPFAIESVEISWARHILAFAPYWFEGSPAHHPLLDEHPEWFMRDSDGAVTGVYTQSLDIANDAWQDHFIDGCAAMVAELGIDGFRLDAPLYNRHANWSQATRRHASYSNLGSLRLMRKLRHRLRAISPDLLVYTEPSGPLVRASLDLSYAYEEMWLTPSLFPEPGAAGQDWRRVRTGKELARWCRDFDASVPPGAVSAHFLDAHDTIWWRLPGNWWRRDQIGLEATKAMLAIFALRGGAYMTVAGGEQGIDAELLRAHTLRTQVPELRHGSVDYDAVGANHDAVYVVLRRLGERAALVAVNTSGSPVRAMCTADLAGSPAGAQPPELIDVWNDELLDRPSGSEDTLRLGLAFAPYQARVLLLNGPAGE
jgi:Alpha amylase, catalytic domain